MGELTPFKPGDWIIASRPKVWMDYGSKMDFMLGGAPAGTAIERRDNSFSTTPIKVLAVTEAHLVYEGRYGMKPSKHILTLSDVEAFGFIIADPALVAVVTDRYPSDVKGETP